MPNLKRMVKDLVKDDSGKRFRNFYHQNHKYFEGRPIRSIVFSLFGILSLLIGVVLLFIPGPGLLFIFIGLALIAAQVALFARWLDRAEREVLKISPWKPKSSSSDK